MLWSTVEAERPVPIYEEVRHGGAPDTISTPGHSDAPLMAVIDTTPAIVARRQVGLGNRARRWLSVPHSLLVEAAVLVAVYVAYDSSRGLAGVGKTTAIRHARTIAAAERHLHLFVEHDVQQAARHVPGLLNVFGFGYATFHLGVTVVVVSWLYFRHPTVFVRVRAVLIAASGVALIGFTLYPTAPPRLAGIGIADTLSLGRATAESGFLRFLYNPYAAMPSIHVAYALIVGAGVVTATNRTWLRVVGVIYPVFVALEVIATGNHFVSDVAAGAAVDAVAVVLMIWLWPTRHPLPAQLTNTSLTKGLLLPGHTQLLRCRIPQHRSRSIKPEMELAGRRPIGQGFAQGLDDLFGVLGDEGGVRVAM
jgi:membrane-associated phospholipid phosphatase